MNVRRTLTVALGILAILVLVAGATPVTASPAPVSACPPCEDGFVRGTEAHGLDTEIRHSEATVRVHDNGSATWTVHVVPTNDTVLTRLAENESLARAVATDSFGIRYGSGIDHELIGTEVSDGTFIMRYRTLDVVREGVLGTHVLTYFRDSPGAYIYTDLGADELTVIAPHGMTIASGFGVVEGRRMTATELPDTRNGPFVVFTPRGSAAPGVLGTLAVINALGGVVVRNLVLLVAVPGGIIVGGLAAIRRFSDPTDTWSPTRLGSLVAILGALSFLGTLLAEGDALPSVTGNLFVGGLAGIVLVLLGVAVAVPQVRQYLTARRFVGLGVVVLGVAIAARPEIVGWNDFHDLLAAGVALLPTAMALGWMDARGSHREMTLARRLFIGIAVVVFGVLGVSAPLTEVGGGLFLLIPILLTLVSIGVVVVMVPLYLLGASGGPSAPD